MTKGRASMVRKPEDESNSDVAKGSKPVIVRFPDVRTTIVSPLKLEAEDLEQHTDPLVLWQVYAVGGFFILKWVFARWNERRANRKSSNQDSPPQPGAGEANE